MTTPPLKSGFISNNESILPSDVVAALSEASIIDVAAAMLMDSGLSEIEAEIANLHDELARQKEGALLNETLAGLFDGVALQVVLPRTGEEDPGLFFDDHVVQASEWASGQKLMGSPITYLSDVPMDYRLTPVPGSRHQELLDELLMRDMPGWFMPSVIGLSIDDALELVEQLPDNVSLVGFNDGWPIVLQHAQFFGALCNDRAFWFTGITSETSGVGFCLLTDDQGNLVLDRKPYDSIQPNDVQGLLIASR